MSKAETLALLDRMSREQDEMVNKTLEVIRTPQQSSWEASIVSAVLVLPVSIAMAGLIELNRLLASRRPDDTLEATPPDGALPDHGGASEPRP